MAAKINPGVTGRVKFGGLGDYPKTVCFKCGSKKSHTNPMARCFSCRQKFCFDHIISGQINKSMKSNDEIRDICQKCKIEHKYKDMI